MHEKSFVVYGDGAMQMFEWLTPYIEQAGYRYKIESIKDAIGARKITITKI